MKKNTGSQLVSAQMISTTDGSDVTTGTCNVAVELDGTAGTGGTATHIANGKWEYAPIQGDTNGDYLTFQFTLTGAVTQLVQIYTSFPQTGDTFTLASGASGFGAIDTVVDGIAVDTAAILADTNELQTDDVPGLIAALDAVVDTVKADTAAILTDTGTTLETHLTDIKGATFSGATDSLEAIRDRGDSAWTTGAGGTPPQLLQNTTIATLATQTSFTLTAGSTDNDAYNGAVVVVTDQSTSTQKAVGSVSDYVGATKTITLSADPGVFTMAVGDTIDIIANASTAPTAAAVRAEIDANSTQLAAIVADTNELQSDDVPGLIAALDAVVDTVKAETALIVADTNELQTDDVPGLIATLDAVVDTVKADTAAILTDTGTTLPATLAALPSATDIVTNGAITTAGGIADVNVQKINDVTITGDGSGTPFNV